MKSVLNCSKNCKIFGFILGAFFSFSLIFGRELYKVNTLARFFQSFPFLFLSIGLYVILTIIFGFLFTLLFNYTLPVKTSSDVPKFVKKHPILFFIIVWLIIFVGWIPAFIAYFPGIASVYDFSNQAAQAYAGISNFSKHHPPLHTFLILLAIKAGERTGLYAVTIYGAVQLVFLSLVIAFQIFILCSNKAPKVFCFLSIIYFALNPTFAVFSIIPVKDAVFGGFFVIFTILLIKLFTDTKEFFNKPTFSILLALSLLSCLLLRKNMLASFLLYVPFLILCLKGYRVKTTIIVLSTLTLFFAVNNILYPSLGMSEGATKEMLCVPMQQIANTYRCADNLSPQESAFVEKYIPTDNLKEQITIIYNPRNADPIKYEFDENVYKESTADFWKQYTKMGIKHPLQYIDALLTLNIPYWYPLANPQDPYSGCIYIETDDNFFIRPNAPNILNFYERICSFNLINKLPIIKYLFYLSMPLWVILICLLGCLSKDDKKGAMIILPGLLLWLTYFIGPISNYRYIYPLLILIPTYVFVLIKGNSPK